MRNLLWLCFFWLVPAAALADGNTSTYTRFDLQKTCTQTDKGDDMVFAGTWKCKGIKGIDFVISEGDERAYVGFGRRPTHSCAMRKTFGRFNTALSPVEWRMKNGRPIAAIQRWRVVTDDDGNSVTWLVVTALKDADSCHIHYVAGSYPKANEIARQAADDIADDFDCEFDAPTVDSKIGEPGIDMSACRDLQGE
jgi:hypothetical protein